MFSLLWHLGFVILPFLGLALGRAVFFTTSEADERLFAPRSFVALMSWLLGAMSQDLFFSGSAEKHTMMKRFVAASLIVLILAGNMYIMPSANIGFIGERHETRMLLGAFLGPGFYVVSLLVNGTLKTVSHNTI